MLVRATIMNTDATRSYICRLGFGTNNAVVPVKVLLVSQFVLNRFQNA